jgi:hypothetical protein
MVRLVLQNYNVSQRRCSVDGSSAVEKETLFSEHDITGIYRLTCRDCQKVYLDMPWTYVYFALYKVLYTKICLAI